MPTIKRALFYDGNAGIDVKGRHGHLLMASLRPAASAGPFLCAEHDRQLGGGSPLSSLMVAKD